MGTPEDVAAELYFTPPEEVRLPRFTCKRCNHTWLPRKNAIPTICPKCKSPYWSKDKIKKSEKPE